LKDDETHILAIYNSVTTYIHDLPSTVDEFDVAENKLKNIDYQPEEYSPYSYDEHFGTEVRLPHLAGELVTSRFTKRLKKDVGDPIGVLNLNPLPHSRLFAIELGNGTELEIQALCLL
jgi:hypothetical protein